MKVLDKFGNTSNIKFPYMFYFVIYIQKYKFQDMETWRQIVPWVG